MYVNKIQLQPISTNEIVPFTVEFVNIPSQSGNTVTSALRYDTADSDDTGTDISANASVSLNVVTISNVWLGAETAAAGYYRVCIVLKDNTGTVSQEEANVFVRVV